jgi:arylsulfatase A
MPAAFMRFAASRKNGTANTGKHLPLFRNEQVIELSPDQRLFTRQHTGEAVQFIRKNKDRPFFVYLPFNMPHVPIYAGPGFEGKSEHGVYSDAIHELDWAVGQILDTLEELHIDDHTMVVFTSDNGATSRGENFPLSGGKANILEGGMRVPCVMRWPKKIPAGKTSGELITVMDFLPTFTDLAGGQLPDTKIDGKNIKHLILGKKKAKSPYEKFFYYRIDQLRAVRSGRWKLHLAVDPTLEGWDGKKRGTCEMALYNLKTDIGEKTNVAELHPEVVKRLTAYAENARKDIGDWPVKGAGQRKAGWVENPVHPSSNTNITPTDWIGNPDSTQFKHTRRKVK